MHKYKGYLILLFSVLATNVFCQTEKEIYKSIWGELNQIEFQGSDIYYKEGSVKRVEQIEKTSDFFDYVDLLSFEQDGVQYAISWVRGNRPESHRLSGLALINQTINDIVFSQSSMICIPNLKSIYTKSEIDSFSIIDKYQYTGNAYKKIKQPFNYIGLTTKVRTDVDVYSDDTFLDKIALISSGSSIQVIGIAMCLDGSRYIIVRTVSGIVGYVKPRIIKRPFEPGTIEFDIPLFDFYNSGAG